MRDLSREIKLLLYFALKSGFMKNVLKSVSILSFGDVHSFWAAGQYFQKCKCVRVGRLQ